MGIWRQADEIRYPMKPCRQGSPLRGQRINVGYRLLLTVGGERYREHGARAGFAMDCDFAAMAGDNACTTDSPRPVPSPTSLVVKNDSKMRSSVAAGMPVPVSATDR